MKRIELTGKYGKGKYALVDDEDFEQVNKWKWFINGDKGYVCRSQHIRKGHRNYTCKTIRLHRYLMCKGDDARHVDHINGDKLDNRRSNLRYATPKQNSYNKHSYPNNTGFKGVHKWRKRYRANIHFDGRTYHLGMHDTPEQAARAYDQKAQELFGEYAYLNFPD